jgi:hypothetical protein
VKDKRRILYIEEFQKLEDSSVKFMDIESRKTKWADHVALVGKMRRGWTILIGEHEVKRPFERPSYRREYNIKMDLKVVSVRIWTGVNCLGIQSRDWLL